MALNNNSFTAVMARVNYFVEQLTQAVTDFDDPHRAIESWLRALPRDELQLIYQRMHDEYCDISKPAQVHWPLGSRILVYNALYNTSKARGEEGYLTIVADRPVSCKFPFILDHNFSPGRDVNADPPKAIEGYPKLSCRLQSLSHDLKGGRG